jgi:SAM-dependent methyltransferase
MDIFLENFINDKFKKPGKALDLGAGKFFDVACLKQLGWEAYGVDKLSGTNLDEPFLSDKKPFDLVYSNYLLHKLKNKEVLIQTAYDNLKNGGWLFINAMDKSNKTSFSDITAPEMEKILRKIGFKNIYSKKISFFDNAFGHRHWHKVLQITASK